MPSPLELLGQFAAGLVASAPEGGHLRIWNQLKPWIASLGTNAMQKWAGHLLSGQVACEVTENSQICISPAVAACDVCHRPCCLNHCRVDRLADAICFACVAEAIMRRPENAQRPPPRGNAGAGGGWGPGPYQAPPGWPPPPGAGGQPPPRSQVAAQAEAVARQALGVGPGATWEEVQRAWKRKSAEHHPDRYVQDSANVQAAHQTTYVNVQKAYETLRIVYGK